MYGGFTGFKKKKRILKIRVQVLEDEMVNFNNTPVIVNICWNDW